jgi:hypothetical protein
MTRTDWLEKVLHDLVKYLEMMPRSLDWNNLAGDDVDVLYESIFETRVDARGTRSAAEIWRRWRDLAPGGGGLEGVLEDVDGHIEVLERLAQPLRAGEDVADWVALRAAIFAVGDRLRRVAGGEG